MDYTAVIASGERRLSDQQQLVWEPIATTLDLLPYTCKALYVCGLLRQRLEAAGLNLTNGFLLDAQSSAFGATELLGQCVGGIEQIDRVTAKRFHAALPYLASLDSNSNPPELVDLSSNGVYRLRCFIDHGAAAIDEDSRFTLPSIIWLLRRLAQALDHFWEADNDPDGRLDRFARAASDLYLQGVRTHQKPSSRLLKIPASSLPSEVGREHRFDSTTPGGPRRHGRLTTAGRGSSDS